MRDTKLDDVGEFIPYAKKHLVKGHSGSTHIENALASSSATSDVTLKNLWKEPDWQAIDKPPDLLAYQAVVYSGIRPKPRLNGFKVTDDEWSEAYKISIRVLTQLFEEVTSSEQIETIPEQFYRRMGVDLSRKSSSRNFRDVYPAYALGRGAGRTYRTPFSFSWIQSHQVKWLSKYGWPAVKDLMKVRVFPIKLNNGQWGVYKVTASKGHSVVDKLFDNADEALVAAIDFLQIKHEEQAGEAPEIFIPKKEPVEKLTSHDSVSVDDITPEKLMCDFGISGIQYGNSMSNVEKHRWVRNAYVSLFILAEIINPKSTKWLGLGGIKLAFAARGSGASAAHYEPSLNVINLTRKNGPGSLAHEWFHALDCRLGKSTPYRFASQSYPSEIDYKKLRPRTAEAIKSLCSLIGDLQKYESGFREQALNLDRQSKSWKEKQYWSCAEEMAARAFEACIQDQWRKRNLDGAWLASGTRESDFPADKKALHPYPIGAERTRINYRMRRIMKLLFSDAD